MEFTAVLDARYSCRAFSDQTVDDADLTRLLEAARIAPTSLGQQEQHIYVVRKAEDLEKLDGLTTCRYGAPLALLVTYDRRDVYRYPGRVYNSGIEDASITLTYLMLAATDAGLATCWVNAFDPDATAEAFNLPKDEELVAILDVGHPAPAAQPGPKHSKHKALDRLVTYL